MVIIHEEYIGRVAEKNIVKRKVISQKEYECMTSQDWKSFFKAREWRMDTYLGYVPVRWTRRRWGDDVKVIDLWYILKELPADFKEVVVG